jgi:hypothetical protein
MFKQTQENVLYFLLDINIKALDNIINDPDSFNDWEILLLNYQSSTQEMVQKVKYIKSFLSSFKTIGGFQLSSHIVLGEIIKKYPTWFNTLRSTLFNMEESLMFDYGYSMETIQELWSTFFTVEEDHNMSYHKILNYETKPFSI